MGLVQNLKKRLGRLAERILVELSYHYIIQKAKQTSRKPDNSLHTEFLQSNLTTAHRSTIIATSSQGTSEKITMEMTTDDIVAYTREWAINKVDESESIGAKDAIYKEFEEWIEVEDDDEDVELLVLEPITEVVDEIDED